jgi:hypothetical protein
MKLANKKKYINRHLNLRNVFRGFKLLFVVSTLLFLMLIKIKNKITDNKTQQMNRVVKILEVACRSDHALLRVFGSSLPPVACRSDHALLRVFGSSLPPVVCRRDHALKPNTLSKA